MNLLAKSILLRPSAIEKNFRLMKVKDPTLQIPTEWQLAQGVLRMWHRIVFHSETVGLSNTDPQRMTLRARLLKYRPIRIPFLLKYGSIAPWDLTGLLSSPEKMMKHLIGTHHDGDQFQYDLEILSCYPEALTTLHQLVIDVLSGNHPDAALVKDLVVYDQYHARLKDEIERHLNETAKTSTDPDISFRAFLHWCSQQPRTINESIKKKNARYEFSR